MKKFLITIIITLVVVGFWSYRNCLVFDTFVFVSTNSGRNLLVGNSENTTPNAGLTADLSKYVEEATGRGLNEIEQDKYYRTKAIEWISTHKIEAFKLYCLKVLNYFNYRNKLHTRTEASAARDLIMLVTYGPLLLLFICRLLLINRIKPSTHEVLLIILYLSSALFYAIFFTRIRFRVPFDFLLIMVVAMFLRNVISGWLGKDQSLEEKKPTRR